MAQRAQAGIGMHMLSIQRVERVLARRPRFAELVFTENERAWCARRARPAAHLAAHLAARGAVLKALGERSDDPQWLGQVWVELDDAGRPHACLGEKLAKIAEQQEVREVALSLNMTHESAVANAVAVTDKVRPEQEVTRDPKEELRATFKAARTVLDELEQLQIAPASVEE